MDKLTKFSQIGPYPFVKELFRDYPVIIDAGARYGDITEGILAKIKNARVFSIEPQEAAYERIEKIKERYNFESFEGILWYEKGTKTVYMWDNPQNSIFPKYPSEKMPPQRKTKYKYERIVKTITLDELIEKYGWIDLLKMNIEGSEYPILENTSEETLGKIGQIAVEAHTGYQENYSFDYMLTLLEERGFDARLITKFAWEQGIIYAKNKNLDGRLSW